MLSGSISTVLGAGVSAVKYPLYLHFLGYEHYGAWLLLSTVLTFAQMGLLGITPAITKLVAEEYGVKNNKAIQEYFITALCMLLFLSTILLTVSMFFRWQIVSSMGLQGENIVLVGNLFISMVLFSIGVLAYQVLNSVLSGVGRIDIANYSQTALQILPLIISIPLLLMNKGIVSLLLANIFAYLAIFLVNSIQLTRIIDIKLFAITSFSHKRLQKMVNFGLTIFAGSFLNMMVVPITKIVITRTIGVEGVPVFELVYRIGMQVRGVFEVAFRALMPEISKFSTKTTQKDRNKIKKIVSKAYYLLFYGAVPFYTLLFLLSDLIFNVWLGNNFLPIIPHAFRIMLIVTFISLVGVIPYYTLMGQGFAKNILIHHVLCASGTLLSLVAIIHIMPTTHIALILWAFTGGATLGTGYLFLVMNSKMANIPA